MNFIKVITWCSSVFNNFLSIYLIKNNNIKVSVEHFRYNQNILIHVNESKEMNENKFVNNKKETSTGRETTVCF